MTESEKLKRAKELFDKDFFEESKQILLSISIDYISNKKVVFNSLLGGCHLNTNDYGNAIKCADNILKINKSNEFASLMKYLSYVYQKDFNKAFIEIFKFLNSYPADLYKDTLEELLSDIDSGFINDEDIINAITYAAEKNGVSST